MRAGEGKIRADEDLVRAGEEVIIVFLMQSHPLTNFQIQKYYQNEPKFNGVCSRNNLPKIKAKTCVTNLDECKSLRTHWISWYVNGENVIYFDSSGV